MPLIGAYLEGQLVGRRIHRDRLTLTSERRACRRSKKIEPKEFSRESFGPSHSSCIRGSGWQTASGPRDSSRRSVFSSNTGRKQPCVSALPKLVSAEQAEDLLFRWVCC